MRVLVRLVAFTQCPHGGRACGRPSLHVLDPHLKHHLGPVAACLCATGGADASRGEHADRASDRRRLHGRHPHRAHRHCHCFLFICYVLRPTTSAASATAATTSWGQRHHPNARTHAPTQARTRTRTCARARAHHTPHATHHAPHTAHGTVVHTLFDTLLHAHLAMPLRPHV